MSPADHQPSWDSLQPGYDKDVVDLMAPEALNRRCRAVGAYVAHCWYYCCAVFVFDQSRRCLAKQALPSVYHALGKAMIASIHYGRYIKHRSAAMILVP